MYLEICWFHYVFMGWVFGVDINNIPPSVIILECVCVFIGVDQQPQGLTV